MFLWHVWYDTNAYTERLNISVIFLDILSWQESQKFAHIRETVFNFAYGV